jgi:hypothetical protein
VLLLNEPKELFSVPTNQAKSPYADVPPGELLDEKEAARHINMSVPFLRDGRTYGVVGGKTPGPPYLKLGASIRYGRNHLDLWLALRRVDPKPQRNIRRAARGR